ncbi:MAG TPA: hypothetical protein RMF84_06245 [Polyangiaceae bacterium LLY-WYZ-14_1]|nr:hypothetical protein [Polyangiaceae bacterium LLY-WYZ-14_1]
MPGDSRLAHRLRLFTQTGPEPASDPECVVEVDVESFEAGDPFQNRFRGAQFSPGELVVEPDEYLFIMVEMVLEGGSIFGLGFCPDGSGETSLWSNATEPPYPWGTLASFELRHQWQVRVFANEL